MKKLKLGAALILISALILFMVQNLMVVEVSFVVWETSLPLMIPILASFFIGGMVARPLLRFLNTQRKERAADKRSAKVAAEVATRSAENP